MIYNNNNNLSKQFMFMSLFAEPSRKKSIKKSGIFYQSILHTDMLDFWQTTLYIRDGTNAMFSFFLTI